MSALETAFDPAYAHLDHPVLAHGLTVLSEEPPLDPDSIDYSLRRHDTVRNTLGVTLQFMHGVESRVEPEFAPSVSHLLPEHPVFSLSTPFWRAHEAMHGVTWKKYLDVLELPPLEGTEMTGRINHHDLVRFIMNVSSDFENMTAWVTASYAELNEYMTGLAYRAFAAQARAIGEQALSTTAWKIIPQEGMHLGVYTPAREWIERRMRGPEPGDKTPWELRLGRRIVRKGMRTVGTEDFGIDTVGTVLHELTRDAPDEFRQKIQDRARRMLDDPTDHSFIDFFNKALRATAARKFTT